MERSVDSGTVEILRLEKTISFITFQLLNSPLPGKKDLAITHLKDYRQDDELINGVADKTEYVFFDTPGIPNHFLYNDPMLRRYMCKSLTSVQTLQSQTKLYL